MGQTTGSVCYSPQEDLVHSQSFQCIPQKATSDHITRNKHLKLLQGYSAVNTSGNSLPDLQRYDKAKTIQLLYRMYSYRRRYSKIKQKLQREERYLLSSLIAQYTTLATKQAESSRGYQLKSLSKRFSVKYNYGLVFPTKLLIGKSFTPSFYCGYVDVHNQRHGYGTLYYQNGSKYEGHWQHDNFIGYNRYIDEEGSLFEGFFVNWCLNKEGIKLTLKGSHYSGCFVNSLKEGHGKEVTRDTIYQGEFHNDQYHGTGVLKNLKENWEYQGQFVDGFFEGIGIITNNSNGHKAQGQFFKGKMVNPLSYSSQVMSTIESEKEAMKITMTTKPNEKTISLSIASQRIKAFSSIS